MYLRDHVATFFHISGTLFPDPHFLVLSIDLELKPHGKPIQLDFWAQKRGFWAFRNFFLKNHGFSGRNEKFFFYLYFLSRNVLKVIPDIIYSYFYHTSPFKWV